MTRRTKIVATLGPACADPTALEKVLRAGTDVCRLNLSHGPLEDHLGRLAMVREVGERLGRHVAVMADLPGPKVRAGSFPEGGVDLPATGVVRLVAGEGTSTADTIAVDYPDLVTHVDVGERVVLGDGEISLRVVSKENDTLVTEVESGGRTQGRPGVHLACERLALHAPTAEDLELAEAMASAGADYIALSFVRRASDVEELRGVIGDRAQIIAKIETAAALGDLAGITAAADAVMVARGDLGIDCPLEDVPHLQKRIIRHCVEEGTPVVTATQMLESMIDAPAPTRAEVSDVANAVFDGTDALMLSAETAIGHDPGLVVSTMSRIAARAETEASYRQWANHLVGCSSASPATSASESPSRSPMPPGRLPTISAPRRSCAARGPGARRGRWPVSVHRHACWGSPRTAERSTPSPCRGESTRWRWASPTRPTKWSGSPWSTPSRAATSPATTPSW